MKWKSNTIGSPVAPKLGDKREKISFALFPVKVQDNWIWFESFIKVQEYQTCFGTYDEVVSSGLIYEKYRTVPTEWEAWVTVGKKFLIKDAA